MTPGQSLVRYDNPVLVSRSDAAANAKKDQKGVAADKTKAATGKKLPPVDDKRAKTPSQTEDILNSILPPRFENIV
jgi:dynein light intermediate chain